MTRVNEQSTYSVIVSWKDGNGDVINIDDLKWSLVKYNGTIINSRDQEEITDPEPEQEITMSGDDLSILDNGTEEKRWLILEATYTDNEGVSRPLTGSHQFLITNLKI